MFDHKPVNIKLRFQQWERGLSAQQKQLGVAFIKGGMA